MQNLITVRIIFGENIIADYDSIRTYYAVGNLVLSRTRVMVGL